MTLSTLNVPFFRVTLTAWMMRLMRRKNVSFGYKNLAGEDVDVQQINVYVMTLDRET